MHQWRTIIALGVLGAGLLFGQGTTGAILGTVTDTTGAVVPGVKVLVTNVDTGAARQVESDSLGNYRCQFLPPGRYSVEAEASGFKKFQRTNFRLETNRELRIDVVLEPGVVSETVTVTSQAPLIETETGTTSTTMENAMVSRLPMLGRDPLTLRYLVPGITGSGIASGGLWVRKESYLLDGGQNSLHVWGGYAVAPTTEVLDEFKVLTNSFSAEFGQTSGFIMLATTKSGTNEFHGSLFEFFRNDKLNAGNFYTHTRPTLRYNQFGATVGGPLRRNRTFFFGHAQWRRQVGLSQWNNLTIPIEDFKKGDFSTLLGSQVGVDALGRQVYANQVFDPASARTVRDATGKEIVVRDAFPGNRIPTSRFSPAAVKLQALYPPPQRNTPLTNYGYSASSRYPQDSYDIKLDHHFSDRDKLTGRYSIRNINNLQPQPLPGDLAGGAATYGPTFYERGQHVTLNEVHIFGPRATNNLYLSFFRRNVERVPAGYGKVGTEDFGIMGMPNGKEKLGTPHVVYSGLLAPVSLGSHPSTLILEPQDSMSLTSMTLLMRDRHSIKLGGEIRRLRINNFQPNPYNTRWTFGNTFTDQVGFARTGIDYASFLLGLPTSMTYNIYPSFIQPRTSVYAIFVQDDIRLTRKLTINAGLRWDAPLHWHERKNRSGVFDLDKGQYVQFGTGGFRTTNWEQDWVNFGPRIGFAYTPFAGSRTVIRGGYGMFTVGDQGSGQAGGMPLSPIFADGDMGRYTTLDRITWRTTLDRIPYEPADKTGRNATAVAVYPAHNPTSYFQQFNLNVQRQIEAFMLEVAYAGSRGVHLPYGGYNWNAIPTALASEARGRFVPPYIRDGRYPGGIIINSWIGSSIYHSLQVKAERRLSRGLAMLAAYTWAKMIATGDVGYRDPINNRNLDRGVTYDSPPHRLTLAYAYQLPVGKGRRWLTSGPAAHILGGWEISGINTFESGYPLTVGSTFDSDVCGAIDRPNLIGNPRLGASERTLDRWFNTGAFAHPPLYSIGNAGRGLFLGPGTFNMDAAVAKRFDLPGGGDGRNLELRGEFFSVTNTPRFSDPDVTFGSATFGRITSVRGGARQIQLALKLSW
jgi:hypothetical protein